MIFRFICTRSGRACMHQGVLLAALIALLWLVGCAKPPENYTVQYNKASASSNRYSDVWQKTPDVAMSEILSMGKDGAERDSRLSEREMFKAAIGNVRARHNAGHMAHITNIRMVRVGGGRLVCGEISVDREKTSRTFIANHLSVWLDSGWDSASDKAIRQVCTRW